MTQPLLDEPTINRLEDILQDLRWIRDEKGDPNGDLEDKINWLYMFINTQPIIILRRDLHNALGAQQEAETNFATLQRDHQLALAGIKDLKHLQKYEGHAKAESDAIGHEIQVRLLKEEIFGLRQKLEAARG